MFTWPQSQGDIQLGDLVGSEVQVGLNHKSGCWSWLLFSSTLPLIYPLVGQISLHGRLREAFKREKAETARFLRHRLWTCTLSLLLFPIWSKQMLKTAQIQGVENKSLLLDESSCKKFVAIFNLPQEYITYFKILSRNVCK